MVKRLRSNRFWSVENRAAANSWTAFDTGCENWHHSSAKLVRLPSNLERQLQRIKDKSAHDRYSFKNCVDLEGAISSQFPTLGKGKSKADAGVTHWVTVTYSMHRSSTGHQQNTEFWRSFRVIPYWLFLNKVPIVRQIFWRPNMQYCWNVIIRFIQIMFMLESNKQHISASVAYLLDI